MWKATLMFLRTLQKQSRMKMIRDSRMISQIVHGWNDNGGFIAFNTAEGTPSTNIIRNRYITAIKNTRFQYIRLKAPQIDVVVFTVFCTELETARVGV